MMRAEEGCGVKLSEIMHLATPIDIAPRVEHHRETAGHHIRQHYWIV